jgi:hypothetical protein
MHYDSPPREGTTLTADIAIIGGGVGGTAAALAACRNGLRVILSEETDWIGGQLTQQAVPPDEHPWIEQFGATRSYREYRNRVRDYYRRNYPLTAEARAAVYLNPGNGLVSRICHEPRVSLAVLHEMIQPHLSSGRLTLLTGYTPDAVETDGDRFTAVRLRSSAGDLLTVCAPYFLDATELGDLLDLGTVEHVTGAESRNDSGEPHAAPSAMPHNQQAFTYCFAMDYLPGEDHIIDRPSGYTFWQNYLPALNPSWPGRLLSLDTSSPFTLEPRTHAFDPVREARGEAAGLWRYRRIIDRALFTPGAFPGDICLVNWPQNDYWLGNLIGVDTEEAATHRERAKQLSLSLLYWLQTEAPRADGGTGWPGLRLRPDVVGTADGLAKYPYVREARRIRAEFTVLEQHVGTDARMELTGKPKDEVTAEPFFDSVGVGSYRIDLHPSSAGDNYIDVSSLPFRIPLGALIPVRVQNLLPAAKNLGVTHITNGCYRLHPVEWNIGESAGALAAYCLSRGVPPTAVRNTPERLAEFQGLLRSQGVELEWPQLKPL